MATPTARAVQRKAAIRRVITASTALAERFGIDPPTLPEHHRDTGYLPTLQLDAIGAFLERVAGSADAAVAEDAATSEAADVAPKTAVRKPRKKAADA
jgi:hypothetical protein